MNKKVYVANLPFQATEPELKALFSRAGSVMSVKIVKDRQTGQPRGIAFVEMPEQTQAQTAIKSLNVKELQGKQMSVSEARPRTGDRRTKGGRMEDNRRRNRY